MSPNSRVWVYQASRELSPEECARIEKQTENFLETWTAHRKNLQASYKLEYNRFLILMIDEKAAMASGCSIDKSTDFMSALEKEYQLTWMDRMLYAYKLEGKPVIIHRNTFEEKLGSGEIHADTIVYNNLVQSKMELETKWEVPLKNSWHKALLEL